MCVYVHLDELRKLVKFSPLLIRPLENENSMYPYTIRENGMTCT